MIDVHLIEDSIEANKSGDLELISEATVAVTNSFSATRKAWPKETPIIARFLDKLCFGMSECWLWRGSRDGLGYGHFSEGRAHRVSWLLFKGPIPDGMKVLHKCDVRNCVNPEHVFLGTQADNIQDMLKKGRQRTVPKFGEDNPMSKLTAAQVREMRNLRRETGMSAKRIAERFGVSTMTAHRAINKTSWSKI